MKEVLSWGELFPEPDEADDGIVLQMPNRTVEGEIRRLRKTVLIKLANEASGDYRVPRNILLIGQASSGKSSFVNLMKSALLGRYDHIATPGSVTEGCSSQFTNRLVPYYNMGFSNFELEALKQEFPDIEFPDDFVLPTICDMPGLANRPHLVLDCILDGIVPDNTELSTPLATESLPQVDFSAEHQVIEHVVFVSSIAQDVSENLFRDAYKVACRGERQIPFTLIFTHIDQAERLSQEQVQHRRNETRNLLWMSKNSKLQSHNIVNYSDDDPVSETDRSVYEVDLNKHREALDALLKIIKPKRRPQWTRISNEKDLKRRYLDFRRNNGESGFFYRYTVRPVVCVIGYFKLCVVAIINTVFPLPIHDRPHVD